MTLSESIRMSVSKQWNYYLSFILFISRPPLPTVNHTSKISSVGTPNITVNDGGNCMLPLTAVCR